MEYFLIIVGAFIYFAAIAFHVLFATHDEPFDDEQAQGLSTFKGTLWVVLGMGVFGEYTTAHFDETESPELMYMLFAAYMLFVLVVLLIPGRLLVKLPIAAPYTTSSRN